MLVSVWARRNAFLWAVLPPVAILAIEGMILRLEPFRPTSSAGVSSACSSSSKVRSGSVHGSGMVTVGEVFDAVSGVFTSYETWLGVLAAAAMILAAIRIRRYRDDS